MSDDMRTSEAGLTPEELAAEGITALPDKEVVSILDLNADLNLALDIAAPIDLAVGANANVAAPIDASVGANVLSVGSTAQAGTDQGAMITQGIVGDATATSHQASDLDQTGGVGDATGVTDPTAGGTDTGGAVSGIDTNDALSGPILNVNVNLDANANLAAPIAGAVAANANVAAPIEASAAANVASIDSSAIAVSNQDAIINQSITGDATAVADQDSTLSQ